MESQHEQRTMIRKALDTALIPVHVAVSKTAQRAYLSTFLFVTTSIFLFCVSSIAYTLFYYKYVPQLGIERTVHLQFGHGNPHGSVSFSSTLIPLQPYDIAISLNLPRTPNNIEAGNFMLELSLISPDTASPPSEAFGSSMLSSDGSFSAIARSRRSAILTYASRITDLTSTISGMPWYLMGWKKESEVLKVSMFEGVEFAKGWKNIPQSARLIIEADNKMQFYDVNIEAVARLTGLRWILYHHRIFSFLFFTIAFWTSSMTSAAVAWLLLSSHFPSASPDPPKQSFSPKHEHSDSEAFDPFSTEDLSDTSRSFPTLGGQMPLHFASRRNSAIKEEGRENRVKKEEEEEDYGEATGIPPLVAEADDEDEEDYLNPEGWRDSGIGTGLDDEARRGMERRRRALFGGERKV